MRSAPADVLPFSPLSRLIDPTYDRAAAEQSPRRAHAEAFNKRSRARKWVTISTSLSRSDRSRRLGPLRSQHPQA